MNDTNKTKAQIIENIKKYGIIDAMGDGISIQDTDLNILYQNSVHKNIIGDQKGEICYKAYEKREQVCDGCPVVESFRDGEAHTVERTTTIDKRIITVEITASPLRDSEGIIIAGIEIVRDITERKRIEASVIESEQKYSNLFNYSNDLIFIHDLDGNILDVNKQCLNIFGYSESELLKLNVMELHPPNALEIGKWAFDTIIKTGFVNFEIDFRKKNGKIFIADVSSSIFKIGGKQVIQGIVRDITERKAMEKERELLNLELTQKNKEFEQIIYITSHDLRSPLVNVDGYSKKLRYSIEELKCLLYSKDVPLSIREKIEPVIEEEIPESLHYISNSISKMDALLEGMLMLLRTGRAELIFEDIDMNEIIADVISNNQMRLNDEGIKSEISSLPTCKGDKNQINQVFSNLIDNAVNYLDSNRTGIIKISGNKERDKSVYCVEDNGIGIAPKYQKKIFNIFDRLNPGRVKGEGLGLTIVQRIIERHKGMIWVESEIGKGSKFFVSIPS